MKKFTKEMIEELGNEVVELCKSKGYDHTSVFFNGKCVHIKDIDFVWGDEDDEDGEDLTLVAKVTTEENCHPGDYFEYFNHNHILSMSFEGMLYDSLNYGSGASKLMELFEKHGVYCELGNSWNLSVYPIDDMEVEGVQYEEEPKKIFIYYHSTEASTELQKIMEWWYKASEKTGDVGSCVIGAGFNFDLDGNRYFMSACSPYQGSCSWEAHTDTVKEMLKKIGTTNITFDYGRID